MAEDGNGNLKKDDEKKSRKWEFSDYAFLITGIFVGVLLIIPEILESQFGIRFLGGSLSDTDPVFVEDAEYGLDVGAFSFNRFRALSPLLFLLTTTIVYCKEAFDARKSGGYKGSLFTYTFESLFEDAIYMAITTVMVYSAVLTGTMYISWLAGPISWVLFIFVFPLVRKTSGSKDEATIPWFLLLILVAGVVVEVITGAWISLPLSWLIICAFKLADVIREKNHTIDTVFDILYYVFSIILMAIGLFFNFWIVSWVALPFALFICWVVSKFGKYKNTGSETGSE